MCKTFKNYNELLILLEDRGINYPSNSNKDYSEKILKEIGYYNLINGYGKPFIDPSTKNFIAGTTIKEIYSLYLFDRKLRSIFLKYILSIETKVKNLIAHTFSKEYGEKDYLCLANFNSINPDNNAKIINLITNIYQLTASRINDPCISHYTNRYGYIPLWVLNNILTLGVISKFYSLMKTKERQAISREFKILDNILENLLLFITPLRNFCAHGNRIYCYRTKKPLTNTDIHKALSINKKHNEYILGKRDLFAGVIALKLLLPKNDFSKFTKEVFRAIGTLRKNMTIISYRNILNDMGFPDNWKEIDKK